MPYSGMGTVFFKQFRKHQKSVVENIGVKWYDVVVVERIHEEIVSHRINTYAGGKFMAVTIKDVAKETNLAISTISKYINGGNVRAKNRKKLNRRLRSWDLCQMMLPGD